MRKILLVALTVGLSLGLLVGCSSSRSAAGRYVNQRNMRDTLVLSAGGTYTLTIGEIGIRGSYEVAGDTITLHGADGSASRATLTGRTVAFSVDSVVGFYGTTWVKD